MKEEILKKILNDAKIEPNFLRLNCLKYLVKRKFSVKRSEAINTLYTLLGDPKQNIKYVLDIFNKNGITSEKKENGKITINLKLKVLQEIYGEQFSDILDEVESQIENFAEEVKEFSIKAAEATKSKSKSLLKVLSQKLSDLEKKI